MSDEKVRIRCPRCRGGNHSLCTKAGCHCECRERPIPDAQSRIATSRNNHPSNSEPHSVNKVVWEDPPPPTKGRRGWSPPNLVVKACLDNPGKWARVEAPKRLAHNFKYRFSKKPTLLPPGKWELSVIYDSASNTSTLYIKYISKEE